MIKLSDFVEKVNAFEIDGVWNVVKADRRADWKEIKTLDDAIRFYPEGTPILYETIVVGGASGGSCWGDEALQFVGDSDFEYEQIKTLLEYLGIHVEEKRLPEFVKSFATFYSDTNNQYYGNYDMIEGYFYTCDDIYRAVISFGWVKVGTLDDINIPAGYHFVKTSAAAPNQIAYWDGNRYVDFADDVMYFYQIAEPPALR